MAQSSYRNSDGDRRSRAVRTLTCGRVMELPNIIHRDASVAEVLEKITTMNWDHLFLVNSERVPIGRIHAVDLLKLISKKTVNRDIAWMHSIPAKQLVVQESFFIKEGTPLLKAIALMLKHDLNNLAVVNYEGEIVGTISHSAAARHLPRLLL